VSRVLYLDGFSGISGDMVLGAFLDAGLPLDDLRAALGSLAVSGYSVSAEPVLRAGVSATRFVVHEAGAPGSNESSPDDVHTLDGDRGADFTHSHTDDPGCPV